MIEKNKIGFNLIKVAIMKKSFLIVLFFLISCTTVFPQNVEKLITPDDSLNNFFHNINITTSNLIRYEEQQEGLTLDFKLPSDWTYTAGKNLQSKFGRIDFAFYNGVLYSNSKNIQYSSFKTRIFPELITDKITSNVFAIGFQKEDQATLIVIATKPIQAEIKIDKSALGRQLFFSFSLAKNECKLIRITKKYPPYLQ